MLQASYYQRLAKLQGSCRNEPDSLLAMNHSMLVDDRKLEDLLVTVRNYAKQTKFLNTRFEEDGTWERLFENDDSLILSTVMTLNGRILREQFIHRRTYGYSYALHEVVSILKIYEDWFRIAKSLRTNQAVDVYLNSKKNLARLATTLNTVIDLIIDEKRQDKLTLPVLESLLKTMSIRNTNQMASDVRFRNRVEKDTFLLTSVEAMVRGLDVLANDARGAFHRLLSEQPNEPAVGMLLAFLKVYQQTQARINAFPEKLMSFYQYEILKNKIMNGEGDRVYVHCAILAETAPIRIPRGTEFVAGKNELLEPLRYESVSDVQLSGAKINALHTVFAQRHVDIAPNNVTGSITQIKTVDLLKQADLPSANLSVFGYESGVSNTEHTSEAGVGFYLTSPLLRLKEGRREITLDIHLCDKAVLSLETARGRFHALTESGNTVKTKAALYQLDISDIEFMSHVQRSNLSVDRLSMVLALYSCLGDRTVRSPAIIEGLIQFIRSAVADGTLVGWAREGYFNYHQLLKECLLYLYHQLQDIHDLGLVHFELLTRQMLRPDFLNDNDRTFMEASVKRVKCLSDRDEMKAIDMVRDAHRNSESCLVHYLQRAFECHLTHEDGWLVHRNYRIQHTTNSKSDAGFTLTLLLENNIPPIVEASPVVHGQQHSTRAPVFILRVNKHVPVCPISWFENFWVERGKLSVGVRGLRDVVVHNEYGQADTAKPFMPFSSIPKYDSRFYVGGYEFASKNVDQLSVRFTWKNLPKQYGGLGAYYAEFGKGMENSDFKVNLTLLAHGSLTPSQVELQQTEPLFKWHSTSQKLVDTSVFDYRFSHDFPKINGSIKKDDYNNLAKIDHGYLCVRLRSSEKAFGHHLYPRLLGDTLAFNAKYKRKNKPLPNTPHTPEISKVEVDYQASDEINFATDFSTLRLGAEIENTTNLMTTVAFHQWPLGLGISKSNKGQRLNPLFPVPNESGNLYVGFSVSQLIDRFCLYFELSQTAMSGATSYNESIKWRYYSQTGWKFLAKEDVVSDTTGNLSRSGIVTFILPTDACAHPGFKPSNQLWLCVSHPDPQYFGVLKALSFDAIELSSIDSRLTLTKVKAGLSEQWAAATDLPGLHGLSQSEESFGIEAEEDQEAATIRLLERLRHKNRAITPWDYERIVLNEFSDVAMVKCLPNCRMHHDHFKAGEILVVLMAASTEQETRPGHKVHLDGLVLSEIQQRLNSLTSNAARVRVVNALYEHIQVRCAVEFSGHDYSGEAYRQLQRDLSHYFSPWSSLGPAAKFSWIYQPNDIEAFILSRPYISRVARVSLVKCFSDDVGSNYFRLEDTAAKLKDVDQSGSLHASSPWSLPLSSRHHQIDLLPTKSQDFEPRSVGINTLEIGNTFVIGGSHPHA